VTLSDRLRAPDCNRSKPWRIPLSHRLRPSHLRSAFHWKARISSAPVEAPPQQLQLANSVGQVNSTQTPKPAPSYPHTPHSPPFRTDFSYECPGRLPPLRLTAILGELGPGDGENSGQSGSPLQRPVEAHLPSGLIDETAATAKLPALLPELHAPIALRANATSISHRSPAAQPPQLPMPTALRCAHPSPQHRRAPPHNDRARPIHSTAPTGTTGRHAPAAERRHDPSLLFPDQRRTSAVHTSWSGGRGSRPSLLRQANPTPLFEGDTVHCPPAFRFNGFYQCCRVKQALRPQQRERQRSTAHQARQHDAHAFPAEPVASS